MFRRVAPWVLTLAVTLSGASFAGCSSPPQKEREQAESAIAAARTAEAADYAASDFNSAVTSLGEYDKAVSNGDYRLALSHAISARDSAYTAAKLAAERKTAARNEAERLIVDFEGLLIVAKSRVASLPPPAATRTRAIVNESRKHLQEARSRLEKQDFKGVVTLLQPKVQTLRKDLTPPAGRRGR